MKRRYICSKCFDRFRWGRWRYWWHNGTHKKKCGPIVRDWRAIDF